MKNLRLILTCLLLSGCGVGGNNATVQHPSVDTSSLQFSPNILLMKVGSTQSVKLFLAGYGPSLSSYSFGLYSSESDIVSIDPKVCTLNNQSPPSCTINITGLKAGITNVDYDIDFPGIPLVVTVVNGPV